MNFKQIDENTFELSFNVGDKLKCKSPRGEDVDLTIMAYVDGFVMFRLHNFHPEVLNLNLFKEKLIQLDCKIN